MKRNAKLEERRKKIPQDVKIYVEQAFKIADQIAFILKKQGKTQRDLATALGKSESEISKWLTGEHNFTMRSLAKIQAALNEPVLLFPLDLDQKIEKTMHVYIESHLSHLSASVSYGKSFPIKSKGCKYTMSSSSQDIEKLHVRTIPLMN